MYKLIDLFITTKLNQNLCQPCRYYQWFVAECGCEETNDIGKLSKAELAFVCVEFLNTLGPRQNGRHFADDIFKCISLNENACISLKISLIFVPKVRINNIPVLVQIMAWRRPGDKPLSEPMMISLLTHICVTRQVTHICVGNLTIIGPDNGLSPGQRQAIIWTNAGILLIGPWGTNFSEILIGIFIQEMHLIMSSAKWRPFCLGLNVLKVNNLYLTSFTL